MKIISTFSIAAFDPAAKEWGIAVQSKFLAAGAMVPYVKAGAGAIATQASANLDYGSLGLELMAKGYSAEKTLQALLATDDEREQRQVGIVDAQGRAAAFTGSQCHAWAGHITGEGFCCQGNILVSGDTVRAMVDAFAQSTGPLARRLVLSLDAGQNAGGDRRGRQAAGLKVVKAGAGYGGFNDILVDLRVDDHPQPIRELGRLMDLHDLYFGETKERVPVTGETAVRVQEKLKALGYYKGDISGVYDESTRRAYADWCGVENYEMRICEGDFADKMILDILLGD